MAKTKLITDFEQFRQIVEAHTAAHCVWPTDRDDYGDDFEPLIVDTFTASAVVAIHDALNPANAKILRERCIASRWKFAHIAEFAFKHTKVGGVSGL